MLIRSTYVFFFQLFFSHFLENQINRRDFRVTSNKSLVSSQHLSLHLGFAIFTCSIPLQVETGDIPVGNPTESQVSQGRIMVRYRKYL